jgi:lipopolysaccharide biosynthesis regulator YciM
MELGNLVLLLLMLIALALAWYSGYKTQFKIKYFPHKNAAKDYFVGLNYLLNDEPDQSIDTFISSLEVNSSTLESHLALGSLLRRRGKVDGSIAVYQKLLANTHLSQADLNLVKLGLVKSYVAAGLLDRAEKLIDELKVAETDVQIAALNQGLVVYQLEKEWQKAILVVNDLLKVCSPNQRAGIQHQASHFYCELAEKELELQHYNQAKKYINNARNIDRDNVRTSLILGKLEFEQGNYKQAIKALLKISVQDPSYKPEAFELIISAYQAMGDQKKLDKFIENSLEEPFSTTLLLMISEYIKNTEGEERAREVILQNVTSNPPIELVGQAILLNTNVESDPATAKLNQALVNFLKDTNRYQCGNCGFELKNLHWLCPGCNEWGKVKPIDSILSESAG